MSELIQLKAQELAAKLSVNQITLDDLDSQIKDLQAKKKNLQKGIDNFKDELREGMADNGIVRIESEEYGVLFRLDEPSEVVSIINENNIPEKFFRVKKEVDKTAVKKALQCGDEVTGAELKTGKHRLTIKL